VAVVTGSPAWSGATSGALVLALFVAARAVVRRRWAHRVSRRLGAPGELRPRVPLVVPAPARLSSALADAAIDIAPDAIATGAVASAGVACIAGAALGGAALALLLPALLGAGALGALVALRGRGDRVYAHALPLGLDLVARSLRTGASLHQAVSEAGDATPGAVGSDLRAVATECRLGRPLVAAVEAWAVRRPLPGVRLAAAALCLGAETGGAQARAVDGVAATLREHVALHGEVRALTSQARTSALVIAVAPVLFCALTVAVDPASATFLLRTPIGLALLAVGVGLDALSAAWMHRLTSRVAA
jgi:tight adherence protein B